MIKIFKLLLSISFILILLAAKISAAEANSVYFEDNFSQNTANNMLNSDKWIIFPNNIMNDVVISQISGNLVTTQSSNTPQYPLIISKVPLPNDNYEVSIKFKYTHVSPWGTGIVVSEKIPYNGLGFNNLGYAINVWQDDSLHNMRFSVNGIDKLIVPVNTNEHTMQIIRKNHNYELIVDDQSVYIYTNIGNKLKYIWMGNPSYQIPAIPTWTTFNIDYVRVESLDVDPFLNLPWDYQAKGDSFSEAALAINSFFDHQYPLAYSNFPEPAANQGTVVNYLGLEKNVNDAWYAGHDGYDYGSLADTKLGTPVLAAASGSATLITNCASCGNKIEIDHHNGYKTIYQHLEDDGLNPSVPNTPKEVAQGEQIGLVGYSGNVKPQGPAGSHLHFGVYKSKDTTTPYSFVIPDDLTDPYGWQGLTSDPWPNYTLAEGRTGSTNSYLWNQQIDHVDTVLTSAGGTFTVGPYLFDFPVGITTDNNDIELHIQSAPPFHNTTTIDSVGSAVAITAYDTNGNLIHNFPNNASYTVTVNYQNLKLVKFITSSLAFYSSPDSNTWIKEQTLTLPDNKVQTSLNHMSLISLMAERRDITPPVTEATLSGTLGNNSWYKSPVTLTLSAQDEASGSGVDYSTYQLNNQEWQFYQEPFYQEPIEATADGQYHLNYYSTDKDGNNEDNKTLDFKIDQTPPQIQGQLATPASNSSWFNQDVTAHFSCTDQLSGPLVSEFTATASGEGVNLSITGTCQDYAGNTTTQALDNINIDKTNPQVLIWADPTILWPANNKKVKVTIFGWAKDNLTTHPQLKFTVQDEYGTAITPPHDFGDVIYLEASRKGNDQDGRHYTITVTATDLAGNSTTKQTTVVVPHDQSDKGCCSSAEQYLSHFDSWKNYLYSWCKSFLYSLFFRR